MPSTKSNLTIGQLKVGAFVLIGLTALGYLILNSTGDFNPFENKMKLKARFTTADGLREGSDVQLAGISIGKVASVTLLPPDSPEDAKVEVTLLIKEDLGGRPITDRIRTDSTAQLVGTSALGNEKMINILPGTSKGKPVQAGHVLDSTEASSINQLTQTANRLLEQMNRLANPANEILNKANQGEGTLGSFINDPSLYNNLDATIASLQQAIQKVNRGEGTAGKFLNNPDLYDSLNNTVSQLESISRDLRVGKGSAGKFINDEEFFTETKAAVTELRASATKLSSIADDLKKITTMMGDGKGSVGRILTSDELYNEVRTTLANFNSTAEKLDSILGDAKQGKGTFGKLLTDETLYNNINQASSNINQLSSEGTKLVYDFRQNPKKYLRIKVSLF
jgi:phospholipid/cholesterol/gamma-HCH transport system substrate-binding protein